MPYLEKAESEKRIAQVKNLLKPEMTVCIDVSLFGHPEFNGVRIETGYEITANEPVPFSKKMDKLLCED